MLAVTRTHMDADETTSYPAVVASIDSNSDGGLPRPRDSIMVLRASQSPVTQVDGKAG